MTDDVKQPAEITDDLAIDDRENGAGEAGDFSFMPGQRLKKARELRGLTPEQVAKELHLSLLFITAMEADDYKKLPEPAFVRGYMRRYAQLVKLSADDIAAKFDQYYAADTETPEVDARPRNPLQILGDIARPRLRMKRVLSLASIGLMLMLVLGVFLFGWLGSLFSDRHSEPVVLDQAVSAPLLVSGATPAADVVLSSSTTSPELVLPVPQAVQQPVLPSAVQTAQAGAQTATQVTAPAISSGMNILPVPTGPAVLPAPVAASVQMPAAAAPTADTVVITLTTDSWVNVRDAQRVLVSELKRGGQTLQLKGNAPFSVNIGSAPGATLSLNGRPVDLKPYTQGAVASFTLKR